MQVTEVLRVGEWEVNVGEKRSMPPEPLVILEKFLTNNWLLVLQEEAKYPWLGVSQLGVPSPIVRIDMAPAGNGENPVNKIYEVEIRPSGLSIGLSVLPPSYWSTWKGILDNLGCEGLVQINGRAQDDFLAANFLGLNYYTYLPSGNCYWIRSDLQGEEAAALEAKSLVPIRDDGDKSYLVRLGLAELLEKFQSLDWNKPFVIKPLHGARCEGVEVFLPPPLKKEFDGSASQKRINRNIFEWQQRGFIVQPFIPPQLEERNGQRGWLIWRIYFGWLNGQYKFIGGLWSWRPNVKNHGAKDTICGALI